MEVIIKLKEGKPVTDKEIRKMMKSRKFKKQLSSVLLEAGKVRAKIK